jgi:DNA-directed RNA polymerase subunit L
MDIRIIEYEEDEISMELEGEGHTFLNALKSTLLADDQVAFVSYEIKHPTISDPVLYVRTEGEDPLVVLKRAASVLISKCDELKRLFLERTK